MNNEFATLTKSNTLTSATMLLLNGIFNSGTEITNPPILSYLSLMGYDVSEAWNNMESVLFDYSTPITQLQTIFNNVESNMNYVQETIDFNIYKYFEWTENPKSIKTNVDRWIDWNNLFKEIIDGANANTQPLVISGELTRDKNGEIIYVGVI